MKIKTKQILLLSSILLLAACKDENRQSSGSLNFSGSSIVDSSSSQSSSKVEEMYIVKIEPMTGVDITADKQKAKQGDTVTLTVQVSNGITLLDVKVNDVSATKVNDTTFTFVMPNRDAVVKCQVNIDGDVILTGDIAAKLELENGIYVARNVAVYNTSRIVYAIKGDNDEKTELNISTLNRRKSNADIGICSEKTGFNLAGNAKYDFYYDPSDSEEPCYIQRRELITMPTNLVQFQSLLAGQVKSEPSTYPEGISKVHYTSTKSNDDYTWEAYENSSMAKVKKLGTEEEKAFVYKSVDGEHYVVVDTYIEATYDDSKREDTTKFSGIYEVVDSLQSGYQNYQYTTKDAEFDALSYSHDVYSIDRNIHYGYRTGFSTEFSDTLKDANIATPVVTPTGDGGFTFAISSYKTSEPYYDATSSTTFGAKEHRTYEISITFNKAGNLLGGTYLEKVYDDTAFNFQTNTFLPNGELQFKLVEDMSFSYTYGDVKSGKVQLADKEKYFVSEITEAKIQNDKMGAENTLDLGNSVENYLKLSFAGSDALDTWQYGIVSSSDTNVIGPRSSSEPFRWEVKKAGTTQLTIANHTTNQVSKTITVTVPNNQKVRGFFMQNTDGDWDNILANSATIYANTVREVWCYAQGYSGNEIDFTPKSSNENVLKVRKQGQRLILDATPATTLKEGEIVNVTIESPYYEDNTSLTVFSITVLPKASASNSIVGTWTGNDASNNQNVTLVFNEDGTGTLSASRKGNDTFKYTFDSNAGLLKITSTNYDMNYIVSYSAATNEISLVVYRYGWGDDYEQDIVGYFLIDEENYDIGSVFVILTRN